MTQPTQAEDKPTFFDRFASAVDRYTSKAWFFVLCVLLVVIWAPTIALFPIDTWQLIINTATTIVTFLLVALMQNAGKRGGDAVQQKLNAIALFLLSDRDDDAKRELKAAIGLEERESTRNDQGDSTHDK